MHLKKLNLRKKSVWILCSYNYSKFINKKILVINIFVCIIHLVGRLQCVKLRDAVSP